MEVKAGFWECPAHLSNPCLIQSYDTNNEERREWVLIKDWKTQPIPVSVTLALGLTKPTEDGTGLMEPAPAPMNEGYRKDMERAKLLEEEIL